MKLKWWQTALTLTSAAVFLAGCGTNIGGDEGVKYEDYVSDKESGSDQFEYEGNYTAPELTIDGLGNDAQWRAITEPLAIFGKNDAATVKVYRGENALFFLFDVKDSCLLTDGNSNDDTVTRSDSIELYLDTLADGGSKPQSDDYQINLGIHGKTRIMQGAGSTWGNWNGLIDYEVSLNGTLNNGTEANDEGYSVEVMIPYSQIGIDKDDTIGVSFGHVDKWGAGSSSGTDWSWYGWTFEGKDREPQTPDNYVLLDKDNNLFDRDNQEKPDAVMAGYVYDSVTDEAIAGANVSVTGGDRDASTVTDSQGYFAFDAVDSENNYTVTIAANGYYENSVVYTRAELRAADGGRVLKTITLLSLDDAETISVSGTVKNVVEGVIAGATVTVSGTSVSAVTGEDGSFTIPAVPVVEGSDVTLVVSKTGYGDSETVIAYSDLQDKDSYEAGDVNLSNAWGSSAPTNFGLKSAFFANSSMQIARTLTGIEMRFEGTRLLSGHLEVYIDTGATGTDRTQDPTCWCFNLNDTGVVTGTHYTTDFTSEGLEYELYYNESDGYSARFFIPYEYLGIRPLEVFGISLGQWSDTANDWDGWGWNGNNTAPENPQNYIRVSALNQLYAANNNNTVVTLSGNAGQQGVAVKVGSSTVTTGADGSWTMSYSVADASAAITVSYSKQGYVTRTSEIGAGWFASNLSWTENVTLEEQKITISGTVTDSRTGDPIEGVTVTIAELDLQTETDANGDYSISGVTTYTAIAVSFTKDGYEASEVLYTATQLAALSGPTNKALISTENVTYVTASGRVTDIFGNGIANAQILLDGEVVATTAESGAYTIDNFRAVDCSLTVNAENYLPQTVSFSADDLEENAETFVFADARLALDYVTITEGEVTDLESVAVTRSETGFEFKFVVGDSFAGTIELYIDAGTSTSGELRYDDNTKQETRNSTDYRFDLKADGTFAIINYGNVNMTAPEEMEYTIGLENGKAVATFTIPYSFIGVEKSDIIGISLGRISSAWFGWTLGSSWAGIGEGTNGSLYVAPEIPTDYMRIGLDNRLFVNACNYTTDVLDLRDYAIEFGSAADMFYAKVTRNESGVTFDFVTFGDFSQNNGQNEMVLIYFDFITNSTGAGGAWPAVDYLVKIASDGTVYGSDGTGKSNGAGWWSATEADKIGQVVITRENGVTRFSYTISTETLKSMGLGSDAEIFGVAMREATHNAGDHTLYDPWYDCFFAGVWRDAANAANYIRVAADGTLYTAASNDPVSAD